MTTTFYRPDRHRDKLRTQRTAERGRGEGQDGQGGQGFGGLAVLDRLKNGRFCWGLGVRWPRWPKWPNIFNFPG